MESGKARCVQLAEEMIAHGNLPPNLPVKDPRIEIALLLIVEGHLDPHHIARRLNLSVSRFQHLFRGEVRISFFQFSKLYRLVKARRIFTSKPERIKQVMDVVGFSDMSRFVKDYKSLFGETPSDTKRQSAHAYVQQLKVRIANKQRN